MPVVKVRNGESLERALRRFVELVKQAGILQEVRSRSRYVKPSEQRRLREKATRHRMKLQREQSKK